MAKIRVRYAHPDPSLCWEGEIEESELRAWQGKGSGEFCIMPPENPTHAPRGRFPLRIKRWTFFDMRRSAKRTPRRDGGRWCVRRDGCDDFYTKYLWWAFVKAAMFKPS